LRREQVKTIRASLLGVLRRSRTAAAADVLLDYYLSTQEGAYHVAQSASLAQDRDKAERALLEIAQRGGDAAPATAVSLAKMARKPPDLLDWLDSPVSYIRANAALALAYLGDRSHVGRLRAMRQEAADSLERLSLASALAMLTGKVAARDLHAELVRAHEVAYGTTGPLDIFRLHSFFQDAFIDGLKACNDSTTELVAAWQSECAPLPPASAS